MAPRIKLPDEPVFGIASVITAMVNDLNRPSGQQFRMVPSLAKEIHLVCVESNCPSMIVYIARNVQAPFDRWGRSKYVKFSAHDHTRAGEVEARSFVHEPTINTASSSATSNVSNPRPNDEASEVSGEQPDQREDHQSATGRTGGIEEGSTQQETKRTRGAKRAQANGATSASPSKVKKPKVTAESKRQKTEDDEAQGRATFLASLPDVPPGWKQLNVKVGDESGWSCVRDNFNMANYVNRDICCDGCPTAAYCRQAPASIYGMADQVLLGPCRRCVSTQSACSVVGIWKETEGTLGREDEGHTS